MGAQKKQKNYLFSTTKALKTVFAIKSKEIVEIIKFDMNNA